MMFLVKTVLHCLFISSITTWPQINLYQTDWINDDTVIDHDCLHVAAAIKTPTDPHQMVSYCLTELTPNSNVEGNYFGEKLTFVDLAKGNITGEELYLWSAPIDLTERYEFYLISNESSSTINDFFYNCTSRRFGLLCQYSFDFSDEYLSLSEMIFNYYQDDYLPENFTCYMHLECDRGSSSICLDWSEICDGYIDCLNGGIDEQFCWELEINKCEEDQYRCHNGQCISNRFLHDDLSHYECLDKSDEAFEILITLLLPKWRTNL